MDDLKKLDQAAMQQNSLFQAVKRKFPQSDIWPGDRSGSTPWPRTQALPDGGFEFIVTYPLLNGCHACKRNRRGALWLGLRCQRKVPAHDLHSHAASTKDFAEAASGQQRSAGAGDTAAVTSHSSQLG